MIDTQAEKNAIRLVWDVETGQLVEAAGLEAKQPRCNEHRSRQGGHFLRGPIPMAWLERACQLPGKAAHVAMAIWFVRGLRQREPFKVKSETLARFGVHHRAVYSRALAEFEGAGLIRVTRKPGQALAVTIILDEPPPD